MSRSNSEQSSDFVFPDVQMNYFDTEAALNELKTVHIKDGKFGLTEQEKPDMEVFCDAFIRLAPLWGLKNSLTLLAQFKRYRENDWNEGQELYFQMRIQRLETTLKMHNGNAGGDEHRSLRSLKQTVATEVRHAGIMETVERRIHEGDVVHYQDPLEVILMVLVKTKYKFGTTGSSQGSQDAKIIKIIKAKFRDEKEAWPRERKNEVKKLLYRMGIIEGVLDDLDTHPDRK